MEIHEIKHVPTNSKLYLVEALPPSGKAIRAAVVEAENENEVICKVSEWTSLDGVTAIIAGEIERETIEYHRVWPPRKPEDSILETIYFTVPGRD